MKTGCYFYSLAVLQENNSGQVSSARSDDWYLHTDIMSPSLTADFIIQL